MAKKIFLTTIAILAISAAIHSQTIALLAEGTKQGIFKAESTKNMLSDRSEITGYLQEVTSGREAASGMATGRRTHQPVIILKQSGASSPQFFQALCTNEVLKKVVIDFYKPDATTGSEINYYTVTLENVSVTGYKQFIGPLENEKFNPDNNSLFDEIKLTFQKITVEDKAGMTIATDDLKIRQ